MTGSIPKVPQWLDAVARKEWRRIVPLLEEMGILAGTDYAVLVGYCEAWSRYKDAVEKIAQTGVLHKSKDGEIRRNPMVFILRDARDSMLKFARELGLSPAARTSVTKIEVTGEVDALAEMLNRRGSLN